MPLHLLHPETKIARGALCPRDHGLTAPGAAAGPSPSLQSLQLPQEPGDVLGT